MMRDSLFENSSNSDISEEEDEDAKELTEDVEKTFFKTLSYIKKKDPKIYDENMKFFTNVESGESQIQNKLKKKKDSPLNLRAYERKLIIERGGELSDEEFVNEDDRPQSPTYTEEQKALKESFKKVLKDDSDNDEESWGGLFRKREKNVQDVKKDDKEYREWLKGRKDVLEDKEAEEDMKFLHDYWSDPKLDQGEQFLRDYILNKRFLDKDDEPELDMDKLLNEEKELEEQTEFEHKYNYRFEEPDQEFIKRYPRVMANTLRVKDERRKEKRGEIKERKLKEKEKKREEIKKKKKIKKQEIEEKLEELKKLTGNDQLAFESHLDADFDQDEYDCTMRKLFNEEFYAQEDPSFNPRDAVDEEYDGLWDDGSCVNVHTEFDGDDLNCEDPNFVMDCDYDPTKVPKKNKKEGTGRRARDKHRRTTVSEAVSREKPVFDPTQYCSFQDYLDQYYGIDCEDFIGDQPCRYKYKRVTPNSYGLTVEEILSADDKELERWCSMKRVHKVGSQHKEKNDAKMYTKKAKNDDIKKKILPSLYLLNSEMDLNEDSSGPVAKTKKKKKQKDKKANGVLHDTVKNEEVESNEDVKLSHENIAEQTHHEEVVTNKQESTKTSDNNVAVRTEGDQSGRKYTDKNQKEMKRKRKNETQIDNCTQNKTEKKIKIENGEEKVCQSNNLVSSKKKKLKQDMSNLNINGLDINKSEGKSRRQRRNEKAKVLKKKLKATHKCQETLKIADKYEKKVRKGNAFKIKKNDNKVDISDSRLKAYGIKPKVFKNKLKYGTQFSMFLDQ